jgi:nitrogen fixation protein FixH
MKIYKSPVMLLAFGLFFILVGATAYRIVIALQTHPGMVVADAYVSGQRYGDTQKYNQSLVKQGWKLTLNTPALVKHSTAQTYTAISSKHGKVFSKAKAALYLYRPLEEKQDFSVPMVFKNGAYQAQITLPLKGRWDALVEIKKGSFLQRTSANLFAQ